MRNRLPNPGFAAQNQSDPREAQEPPEQDRDKDRQIEQLHVLLQQVQAALPPPRPIRPWWRVWRRSATA